MVRKADLDPSVALPPGLDIVAVRNAIEYVERKLAELVDIYCEQYLCSEERGKKAERVSGYQQSDVRIKDGKPVAKNGQAVDKVSTPAIT